MALHLKPVDVLLERFLVQMTEVRRGCEVKSFVEKGWRRLEWPHTRCSMMALDSLGPPSLMSANLVQAYSVIGEVPVEAAWVHLQPRREFDHIREVWSGQS